MQFPWSSTPTPPEPEPAPEFLDELLAAAPRFEVQWTLALIQAAFWFVFIKAFTGLIVKPFLDKHPKREQFAKLNQMTFKTGFGIDFTQDKAYMFGCDLISILVQHAFGGILCVPSAFGFAVPAWSPPAQVLASFGALCETGWEIQDLVVRVSQILFHPEGKIMNPPALMIILAFHHGLGMGMVIPMNVYCSSNALYHELVFLLQFAAFVAMSFQQAGYLLDIKTASGLRTMKIYVTITWVTMVWSRGIRFVWVAISLVMDFYAEGQTGLLIGGGIAASMMSLLNLLMLADATAKLKKFAPMELKEETFLTEEIVALTNTMTTGPLGQAIRLTASKKSWAKVRGAVSMGALRAKKQ